MASPYQEFVRKARERFEENKKKKARGSLNGQYQFTAHARYKMSQYGLSEQKVKGILRHPKRSENGIAPKTGAMMQPVSPKVVDGKEVWKQEIWVMYQLRASETTPKANKLMQLGAKKLVIISAWRYPGISPKRNPIPEEIWQELQDGDILEAE
ncbi:MAG: hypothetical protein Q8O53_03840 [Candidatus Moranbacteria bacterium]|nr:hypothetical protein [Candidatus Moranbacteria bacterium]